jgi:hypothetical protein
VIDTMDKKKAFPNAQYTKRRVRARVSELGLGF